MKEALKVFAPLLVALVLVASAFLILRSSHQDGYDEGYRTAQAEGATELEALKSRIAQERLEVAEESRRQADEFAQALHAQTKRGDDLVYQLATTKQELRRTTDKLNGEIQRVTTLYRRSLDAPPEPLPAAVFTTGFVRVWNEALNPAAMRAGEPASGAAAPAGRAGAADDLDSRITPADLLTNQVRNSEKHATCRAQLTRLIEYYTHGR